MDLQKFEQLLFSKGWKMYKECYCGGRHQRKYHSVINDMYSICYYFKTETFNVYHYGIKPVLVKDEKLENIEKIMIEHGLG